MEVVSNSVSGPASDPHPGRAVASTATPATSQNSPPPLPLPLPHALPKALIGQPILRKEGRDKVTGKSKYIDDLSFPSMIFGATVRSTIPRGRIVDISFSGKHIPWDEFVIVKACDIPGKNSVPLILSDQPFLADSVVNHSEEP